MEAGGFWTGLTSRDWITYIDGAVAGGFRESPAWHSGGDVSVRGRWVRAYASFPSRAELGRTLDGRRDKLLDRPVHEGISVRLRNRKPHEHVPQALRPSDQSSSGGYVGLAQLSRHGGRRTDGRAPYERAQDLYRKDVQGVAKERWSGRRQESVHLGGNDSPRSRASCGCFGARCVPPHQESRRTSERMRRQVVELRSW